MQLHDRPQSRPQLNIPLEFASIDGGRKYLTTRPPTKIVRNLTKELIEID